MCSYYILVSHRPTEEDLRLSREECHRYCTESSQCATCCRLNVVSLHLVIRKMTGRTKLKCLAFFEDLLGSPIVSNRSATGDFWE